MAHEIRGSGDAIWGWGDGDAIRAQARRSDT